MMGKVYDRRAALGNHQRQRAQTTMMLHGWVPRSGSTINGACAFHVENNRLIMKEAATGKACILHQYSSTNMFAGATIEWDDVSTVRVLWLYKIMLREKFL